MHEEFLLLEKTLKTECARGPVYYFPNRGNWGDALIREGTLKFFKDINLDFRELSASPGDWMLPVLRGGTVLYGGGGAWRRSRGHSPDEVARLRRRFKVIVLPSSYEKCFSIPDTLFFCRDRFESQRNMPQATFCHDLAFYLGNGIAHHTEGSGKGYFFRSDSDCAPGTAIPPANRDLSVEGTHLSEVGTFFAELCRFAAVYTNRLHVAIAACQLGKEVHVYEGAYFKNRAVYQSSMKDNFGNVHFHEDFVY